MTVLYPTPLLTKELSTTPNQPLGSGINKFMRGLSIYDDLLKTSKI